VYRWNWFWEDITVRYELLSLEESGGGDSITFERTAARSGEYPLQSSISDFNHPQVRRFQSWGLKATAVNATTLRSDKGLIKVICIAYTWVYHS
jgi:hypothetical protein